MAGHAGCKPRLNALQPDPAPAAILERHRSYFDRETASFVEVVPDAGLPGAPLTRRYHPAPAAAQGWIDLHAFANGLTVSRMDCRLAGPRAERHHDFPDSLRLNVLLDEGEHLHDQHGRAIEGQTGDIVVRHGDPGPLAWQLPAGSRQRGLALELPRAMVQTLAQQGLDLSHLGAPGSCNVLRPRAALRQHLRAVALRMLALPAGASLLARLELESLALDLLLRLLHADTEWHDERLAFARGKPVAARWQAAVDEAVDIVQTHRGQPLTIAQLARRVGINECYLKELFRLRTGSTIAAYQRKQRMQHARELIESGQCTVQRAALACGYARTDKFAEAFVRAHGISPSALTRL